MNVPIYFSNKAVATRILGFLLLILASPVILLLVAIVRCTSRGPGLFKQARVGKWGQEFTMYKIRTMYQDAEKTSGPVWCRPADSRITCCGRVLRFLHLDELPQLINIVRGEMDLIGPRPERPQFVDKLVNEIPEYAERLNVLPGVTGLAQINLPPDETTDCVRRKLVLDIEYIKTASILLDLRILVCTILRMCGIRHGYAVKLLNLARIVPPIDKLPGNTGLDSVGLENASLPMFSTPECVQNQTLRQANLAFQCNAQGDGSIPHLVKMQQQADGFSTDNYPQLENCIESGAPGSLPKKPK